MNEHGHVNSPVEQSAGGLESDQAAAQDQGMSRSGKSFQHLQHLMLIAHEKDIGQMFSTRFDGSGVGAGSNEKGIKGQGFAIGKIQGFCVHIHSDDPISENRGNIEGLVKAGTPNGKFRRGNHPFENKTDHGPAIRNDRLVADHENTAGSIQFADGLGCADTGNAVSDDDVIHG